MSWSLHLTVTEAHNWCLLLFSNSGFFQGFCSPFTRRDKEKGPIFKLNASTLKLMKPFLKFQILRMFFFHCLQQVTLQFEYWLFPLNCFVFTCSIYVGPLVDERPVLHKAHFLPCQSWNSMHPWNYSVYQKLMKKKIQKQNFLWHLNMKLDMTEKYCLALPSVQKWHCIFLHGYYSGNRPKSFRSKVVFQMNWKI